MLKKIIGTTILAASLTASVSALRKAWMLPLLNLSTLLENMPTISPVIIRE